MSSHLARALWQEGQLPDEGVAGLAASEPGGCNYAVQHILVCQHRPEPARYTCQYIRQKAGRVASMLPCSWCLSLLFLFRTHKDAATQQWRSPLWLHNDANIQRIQEQSLCMHVWLPAIVYQVQQQADEQRHARLPAYPRCGQLFQSLLL